MHKAIGVNKSFFEQDNNISCRGLSHRFSRFMRAQMRTLCNWGKVIADDPRVLTAWRNGWDAVHYSRFLRWHDEGFKPSVVYDIGAHEGLWAEMCQAVFLPDNLILFEPQKEFQKVILNRQKTLGVKWLLVPFALGEEDTEQQLYLTKNRAASSLLQPVSEQRLNTNETTFEASEVVPIRMLDSLTNTAEIPFADLIKIDVQGFEGAVLSGGREAIRHAKRLIVEVSLERIYAEQPLLPEVLHTATELGYELDDITETLRGWPDARLWQVDLWLKRKQKR